MKLREVAKSKTDTEGAAVSSPWGWRRIKDILPELRTFSQEIIVDCAGEQFMGYLQIMRQ